MKLLNQISNFFNKPKNYSIQPINDGIVDLTITHRTGVVVQIGIDGTVVIASPKNLELYARGELKISSDKHIGLSAPRIDLN